MTQTNGTAVEKQPTFIEGFDFIACGGLPEGRTALLAGTAGSAKTVFAIQFLAGGIRNNHDAGVFVTFEEPPEDIRKNAVTLGFEIARWESEGKWAFVDASPTLVDTEVAGEYNLIALISRIEHAVKQVGARRVVLDTLSALLAQFQNDAVVRREVSRISSGLRQLGVTALITAERARIRTTSRSSPPTPR